MPDFLNIIFMEHEVWMWLVFLALIAVALFVDLGLFHKEDREINIRESLTLTAGYIILGLLFGIFVWYQLGHDDGIDYYTGFIIEKSLSVDNLFVMSVIFTALSIPRKYQHRVLFWGIMGVIILRGIMIALGSALVHEFEEVLYVFAIFLIFTGIKLLFVKDDENHEDDVLNNPIIKFLNKHFRVTGIHGNKFFIKLPVAGTEKVARHITPLFIALVTIEFADVIFAVDSVPAIFAITTDPYIVYTSNIFAILGLRALYFSLSAMIERFRFLKYAISLILVFIGMKVFAPLILPIDKVPPEISLTVTLGILLAGITFSMVKTRAPK
jgi:tellurite resistance protein TerC